LNFAGYVAEIGKNTARTPEDIGKYDVSKAKEDDTKAEQIKTELEAYMFYYHRYEAHHNAMKIADEQRLGADKKRI